eukprot:TRINITY_DN1974_c0_g1_i6.p1 TRINITY_DN1974_c0_g1~~TRINITY_DN1974_c0_g1_i6.p1  ORF type:complete len:179 (+),score=42.71 TRINITY_DN1974_c0_g1_i6:177-713(+)
MCIRDSLRAASQRRDQVRQCHDQVSHQVPPHSGPHDHVDRTNDERTSPNNKQTSPNDKQTSPYDFAEVTGPKDDTVPAMLDSNGLHGLCRGTPGAQEAATTESARLEEAAKLVEEQAVEVVARQKVLSELMPLVRDLTEMGFEEEQAIQALVLGDGDLKVAVRNLVSSERIQVAKKQD